MRAQEGRRALGSDAVLTLRGERVQLGGWFSALWHEIGLFEQTFSRFLPDSELSRVNAGAGLPVPVSPEFIQLLRSAVELSREADGLFNPLVLPDLQRAGYKGSWPRPEVPGAAPDYTARRSARPSDIITDGTVQLPPDAALDFGGIGKGYLLDRLAGLLGREGCGDFWLSLGGDIIMQGFDETGQPWQIGIAHAQTGAAAAQVRNDGGERLAVATSGVTKRHGPGWHHIIDPRTGRPAKTDLLTATVCDPSGTRADVFAKCLVIVGTAGARDFMRKHRLNRAVLQSQNAAAGTRKAAQNADGPVIIQTEGL